MKFNEKLKSLRLDSNLEPKDVAEAIGVTTAKYNNFEKGKTTPDLEQIKILSEYYKISIDELVKDKDEEIKVKKVTKNSTLYLWWLILITLFILIVIFIFKTF